MNIDRTTIVIRERSLGELHDLALMLLRRHAGAVLALAVIGCAPFALLDWWLLSGVEPEWWALHWWWLLLLVAVQGPLATAPLSAYLGSAVFEERPSIAAALRAGFAAWRLLIVAGVVRGVCALIPPVLLAFPAHVVETRILEGGSPWRRAAALRNVDGGAIALHWLVALLVAATAVLGTAGALHTLRSVLWPDGIGGSFWLWLDPGSAWMVLALWAAAVHLAIVRFLAYIDLRTRHEGWELGLQLSRVGRRLS